MQDLFHIYDLEFNRIPLPKDDLGYGLTGMGIVVSSIGQEVMERTGHGIPGSAITGVRDSDRNIALRAWLESKDSVDYLAKRDKVYAFFRSIGAFYVAEARQANKLIKVRVVEQYTPEVTGGVYTLTTLDIPLKLDGHPYWISRFKTMNLFDSGEWSFGMGDRIGVTPEDLVYQYENVSKFNIFNDGIPLKTIQEKGNCEIKIEIKQAVSKFSLYDATDGKWEYTGTALKSGDVIIFNGHDVRLNGTTIMSKTNRYYPVILSGINNFEVLGLTQFKISFNFRFKYY